MNLSEPSGIASSASASEIEQYMNGQCHHLAIALRRHLGWEMEVYLNYGDPYWQDENDPANSMPCPLHVYAVDKEGWHWDINGRTSASCAKAVLEAEFSPTDLRPVTMKDETPLRPYVSRWVGDEDAVSQENALEFDEYAFVLNPARRPLCAYSDKDIEDAWQVAQRVFAKVPGFSAGSVQAAPSRRRATP